MNAPLNRDSASASLLLNHTQFKTGIVHIGLGNFHRAHFAVYTAKAMEKSGGNWGICAYTFRNQDLVAKLQSQENLYSVLEIGPDTEAAYIPNAHTEFVVGYENANYISNVIAGENTKIISLTVTEAGYLIDQTSGGLNWNDSNIENDLEGNSPRTIYGLIINGLKRRNQNPITILSCDNISHNGDLVKRLLLEYAAKAAPDLIDYLNSSVTFPNSMVDRIVPGTEVRHLELAKKEWGLQILLPYLARNFQCGLLKITSLPVGLIGML
jgi:fructuronate reductase